MRIAYEKLRELFPFNTSITFEREWLNMFDEKNNVVRLASIVTEKNGRKVVFCKVDGKRHKLHFDKIAYCLTNHCDYLGWERRK